MSAASGHVRQTLLEAVRASLAHAGRYNPGDVVAPAELVRWMPGITWTAVRGKESQRPKDDYPWFWGRDEKTEDFAGGKEFDGNRCNDCHYTNKVKQAARAAAKKA